MKREREGESIFILMDSYLLVFSYSSPPYPGCKLLREGNVVVGHNIEGGVDAAGHEVVEDGAIVTSVDS